MPATNVHFLLQGLDLRRKKLGMSHAVLAKRAGMSMRTVVRVLSGSDPQAGFANVAAIAEVLGIEVKFTSKANVEELRERQARQKAQRLVGMVQGTMGRGPGGGFGYSRRDVPADHARAARGSQTQVME